MAVTKKSEIEVKSILSHGDGAHKLNIAATEALGDNAVLEQSGHEFGKGADNIAIELKAAKADAAPLAQTGLKNAYIDLGEGNNSFTVAMSGGAFPANSKGLDGGSGTSGEGALLLAGKGSDKLTLSGMATALDTATVNLGAGANSVNISATTAMTASVLVTEGGNDTVTMSGDISGASTISLGEGNNTLTLNGKLEGNSQVAAGAGADALTFSGNIENGAVTAGDGKNTVVLKGDLKGTGPAPAESTPGNWDAAALIGTGKDVDTITVSGAVDNALIDAGAGNDVLTLSGAIANASVILAGDGKDTITLNGKVNASVTASTIDAGAGDDTVYLRPGLLGAGTVLKGGDAGADTLKIAGGGMTTLSLLSNGATISGFETLDMTDKIGGALYVREADLAAFTLPDLGMTAAQMNAVKGLDGKPAGALATALNSSGANVLRISGDKGAAGDKIYFAKGEGWAKVGTALGGDVWRSAGGKLVLVQGLTCATAEASGVEDLVVTLRAGAAYNSTATTASFNLAAAEGLAANSGLELFVYNADENPVAGTQVNSAGTPGTGGQYTYYDYALTTSGGDVVGKLHYNKATTTAGGVLTVILNEDVYTETSLASAKDAVSAEIKALDKSIITLGNDLTKKNTALTKATTADDKADDLVTSRQQTLTTKQAALADAQAALEAAAPEDKKAAQTAVNTAQTALNTAQKNYDSAVTAAAKTQAALDAATTAQAAAQSAYDAADTAKTAAEIELDKLVNKTGLTVVNEDDLYYTYQLGAGEVRTLRIDLSAVNFAAAKNNTETLTAGALGSFYAGAGNAVYKITGGAADDNVRITGTALAGSKIDLGYGTNSLQTTAGIGGSGARTTVISRGENTTITGGTNGLNNAAVTLSGASATVSAGKLANSTLALGDGSKGGVFTVSASSTTTLHGIDGSAVSLGKGDDALTFNLTGSIALPMMANSSVKDAGGNNVITVTTTSGTSIIMENSSITTGAGNDAISVAFNAGYAASYMMSTSTRAAMNGASSISAGAGDDAVSVRGSITGGGPKAKAVINLGEGKNSFINVGRAVSHASISAGKGDDAVEVNLFGGSSPAIDFSNTTVSLGEGKNSFALSGIPQGSKSVAANLVPADWNPVIPSNTAGQFIVPDTTKAASFVTARASTFSAGKGNDTFIFTNASLEESAIKDTGGNNLVRVVTAAPAGTALDASKITLGAGNDVVEIRATAADAVAALDWGSSISTGAGNDAVTIEGNVYTDDAASKIDLGAGTNSLSIDGDVGRPPTYSPETSLPIPPAKADYVKILGGAGVDTISISGGLIGGATISAGAGNDSISIGKALGEKTLIDGGAGTDVLNINALARQGAGANALMSLDKDCLTGGAAGAAVKNIEVLDLGADLWGGNKNILLTVTGKLETAPGLAVKFTTGGKSYSVKPLVITGDAQDSFLLGLDWKYLGETGPLNIAGLSAGTVYHALMSADKKSWILVDAAVAYIARPEGDVDDLADPVENMVITLNEAFTKTAASLKMSTLIFNGGGADLTVSGTTENTDISLNGGATTNPNSGESRNVLTLQGDVLDSAVSLSGAAGTKNSVTLAGNASYSVIRESASGASDDTVTLSDAGKTFGNGEIALGEGENSLTSAGSIENSAVTAGAGNDAVALHEAENVTVGLGAGENSFAINGAYKKLSVSGAGESSVTVSGTDGETREDLLIELGAGADAVTVGSAGANLTLKRTEINLGTGENELELHLKKLNTNAAGAVDAGVVLTGVIGANGKTAIIDFAESGAPDSRSYLSIGKLGASTLVNGLDADFGSGQNTLNMIGSGGGILAVENSTFSFAADSVNTVTIQGENLAFGGSVDPQTPGSPRDPGKDFTLDLNYSNTALTFTYTGAEPVDGLTFANIGKGALTFGSGRDTIRIDNSGLGPISGAGFVTVNSGGTGPTENGDILAVTTHQTLGQGLTLTGSFGAESSVVMGAGNDSLTFDDSTGPDVDNDYGIVRGVYDLGEGNNTVTASIHEYSIAYGFRHSGVQMTDTTFLLGGGANAVNIRLFGNTEQNADTGTRNRTAANATILDAHLTLIGNIASGTILTAKGDDRIALDVGEYGGGSGVGTLTVDLYRGDDVLTLRGAGAATLTGWTKALALNGGEGTDTLKVGGLTNLLGDAGSGKKALFLSADSITGASGFEILDFSEEAGAATLFLSGPAPDLGGESLSYTINLKAGGTLDKNEAALRVTGKTGDSVVLGEGWSELGATVLNGKTWKVLQDAEGKRLLVDMTLKTLTPLNVSGTAGALEYGKVSLTGPASVASLAYSSVALGNNSLTVSGDVTGATMRAAGNVALDVGGKMFASAVDLGDGNNSLSVSGETRSSSLASGAGADALTLGNVHASVINTGAGDDTLTAAELAGDSRVLLGAGNDALILNGAENAIIDMGSGLNAVTLNAGSYTETTVDLGRGGSTLAVTGSAEADSLTFSGVVRGAASVSLGAGDDSLSFSAGALGALDIETGDGNDYANLEYSFQAAGAVAVKLGAGDDTLRVRGTAWGAGLSVDGDAGTDTLILGRFGSSSATVPELSTLGALAKFGANVTGVEILDLHYSLSDVHPIALFLAGAAPDFGGTAFAYTINLTAGGTEDKNEAALRVTAGEGDSFRLASDWSIIGATTVDGIDYHVAERAKGTSDEQRVLVDAALTRAADLVYAAVSTPAEAGGVKTGKEIEFTAAVASGTLAGNMTDSLLTLYDGANTFTISGTTGESAVTGGSGADVITVATTTRSVIDLGAGNNTLKLSNALQQCLVLAGDGKDILTSSTTANRLISENTIDLGDGDNEVSYISLNGYNRLRLGNGNDMVSVAALSSSHVELGDGTNTLTVSGNVFAATTSATHIFGGSGADAVTLAGTVGTYTYIAGAINLDLGDGNDELTIGQTGTSLIVGSATFSYNSVTGIAERLTTAACALNAELGDGANVFVLHGLNETTYNKSLELTVGGNLANGSSLAFGAGNGLFILHDSEVSGTVNIDMKAGDDAAELRDVTLAADAAFTLDLGEGNDSLTLKGVSVTSGGAGVLKGGAGTDTLKAAGLTNLLRDAGDGTRALFLSADSITGASGFEILDFNREEAGAATFFLSGPPLDLGGESLNYTIALSAGGTANKNEAALRVTGKTGDSVVLGEGWSELGTTVLNGATWKVLEYAAGNTRVLVDAASLTVKSLTPQNVSGSAGALEYTNVSLTGSASVASLAYSSVALGNNSLTVSGDVIVSAVDLGEGGGSLSVTGDVSGTIITGGDGGDGITLSGAVTESTINLGGGANTLTLAGDGSSASPHSMKNTTITGGDGGNTIVLDTAGDTRSFIVDGTTTITLGAGADTVTVGAGDSHSVKLEGSSELDIALGGGNDALKLDMDDLDVYSGAKGALNGGEGSDTLTLKGTGLYANFIFGTSLPGHDHSELKFENFEALDLESDTKVYLSADVLAANGEALTADLTLEGSAGTIEQGSSVLRVTGDNAAVNKLLLVDTDVSTVGVYIESETNYTVFSYQHDSETRYILASGAGVEKLVMP